MASCFSQYLRRTFDTILTSADNVQDHAGVWRVKVFSPKDGEEFYVTGAGTSMIVTLSEVGKSENTFRMYASEESVAKLDIREEWCRKKNEELSKKQT